jgi:insecticidal toxin complex protein TccC
MRPGEQWRERDARLYAQAPQADGPMNVRRVPSLSGAVLAETSTDAGRRVSLLGVAGQGLQTWHAQVRRRIDYDDQLRPTAVYERETASAAERCVERLIYGGPEQAAHNCCGRLIRHDDPAGTVNGADYGLGGQPLQLSRRFLDGLETPDWPAPEAERDALLEALAYPTRWTYDAVGATVSQTDAQGHRRGTAYTVDGQIKAATLTLAGDSEQTVLTGLAYNAAGQLLTQQAGNGVVSTYTYDPASGRLRQAVVRKETGVLQDHRYAYDPVGNVVRVEDTAVPSRYFNNRRIQAVNTYAYDSLGQLVEASGRESAGAHAGQPGLPVLQPIARHADTLTPYTQTYAYDAGGNLTQLRHQGERQYTLGYAVADTSNRTLPWQAGEPAPDWESAFDRRGNLQRLSRGGAMLAWDARNQLRQVTVLARGEGEGEGDAEVYVYDGGGQRVRKVTTAQAQGRIQARETRYLPGLEYHTNDNQAWTVIQAAGVRVLHWTQGRPTEVPNDQHRYAVTDHLGSTTLELDQHANLLSAESYYPYGGTAAWAGRNQIEASYKTIRYSGKERDASGLVYYGFRYYAPWTQRWLNPDPAGDIDGVNRYRFVRNSPLLLVDSDGRIPKEAHFIWLGGSLPDYGRMNIIAFKKMNPDWNVTLWSDNPAKLENTLKNSEVSSAFFQQINVRDASDIIANVPEYLRRDFASVYTREISGPYKNYAAGSDLLRLAIDSGGLYMDIDISVRGPVGDIEAAMRPSASVLFGNSGGNDIIASEPKSDAVRAMLSYAVDRYTAGKVNNDYFGKAIGNNNFRAPRLPAHDLMIGDGRTLKEVRSALSKRTPGNEIFQAKRSTRRTMLTVGMTGPRVLHMYLNYVRPDIQDRQQYYIKNSSVFGHLDQSGRWTQMNREIGANHWSQTSRQMRSAETAW